MAKNRNTQHSRTFGKIASSVKGSHSQAILRNSSSHIVVNRQEAALHLKNGEYKVLMGEGGSKLLTQIDGQLTEFSISLCSASSILKISNAYKRLLSTERDNKHA